MANDPMPVGPRGGEDPVVGAPAEVQPCSAATRHGRHLSDKILVAFHHACDQNDVEVARALLDIVECLTNRQVDPYAPGRGAAGEAMPGPRAADVRAAGARAADVSAADVRAAGARAADVGAADVRAAGAWATGARATGPRAANPRGGADRRGKESLVAAHERLWHICHPPQPED